MKYYMAPLESVTNYRYRKHYHANFKGIDRFYIPFLQPHSFSLTNRDRKEIDIKNNVSLPDVVPQIISNSVEDTLWLINMLNDYGYKEVNLNFGCPSGTVVSKGRGAGIFKDLAKMREYLSEIFAKSPLPISIKTRIGYEKEEEFWKILEIYNEFPIKELIIHPRTCKEHYVGPLHLDVLDDLDKKTSIPVVYNGEIKNKDDIEYIKNRYPYINAVMLGRGLLEYPDVLADDSDSRNAIKNFVLGLSNEFINDIGWGSASFPIKELWSYISKRFDITEQERKKLFKAKDMATFMGLAEDLLDRCPLKEKPGKSAFIK